MKYTKVSFSSIILIFLTGSNVKTGDDVAIKLVSSKDHAHFMKCRNQLRRNFLSYYMKRRFIKFSMEAVSILSLLKFIISWYTVNPLVWGRGRLQRYGHGSSRSKFRRSLQLLQEEIHS